MTSAHSESKSELGYPERHPVRARECAARYRRAMPHESWPRYLIFTQVGEARAQRHCFCDGRRLHGPGRPPRLRSDSGDDVLEYMCDEQNQMASEDRGIFQKTVQARRCLPAFELIKECQSARSAS